MSTPHPGDCASLPLKAAWLRLFTYCDVAACSEEARDRAFRLLSCLESDAGALPEIRLYPGAVTLTWWAGAMGREVLVGGGWPPIFRRLRDDGIAGLTRNLESVEQLREVLKEIYGKPTTNRHEMMALCEVVPAMKGGCDTP